MKTRLAAGLMLTMVAGLGGFGRAATASTSVEVVQSVPLETTLAVPGVRDTRTVWLELIASATQSIDLEEFYINEVPGQSLTAVINAIKAAAAKGVHVRFLLDHSMYQSTYSAVPNALAQVPGIEVETIDFSSRGGIMHAKYIVVDGQRAYVGSANFDWLALSHIHEVGMNVADEAIGATLESIFSTDWAAGQPVSTTSQNPATALAERASHTAAPGDLMSTIVDGVGVLASPPDLNPSGVGATLDRLRQLIGGARTSVLVQVYEYNTRSSGKDTASSWKDLDGALRAAAAKGVQVELAVDHTALSQGKADLESLAKVKNVQVKVVTIPEWSGGHLDYARLIHSKYLVADGVNVWVGSENWNEGYFTDTRNVGLTMTDATIGSTLTSVFHQVWTSDYTSAP